MFFNIFDFLFQSWKWMRAFNSGRFPQLVSLTIFLFMCSSTYFPWGLEFAIFQPFFLQTAVRMAQTVLSWSTGIGLTNKATTHIVTFQEDGPRVK
jgi:hypothetical protein